MAKYLLTVTEVATKHIIVEADSPAEAKEIYLESDGADNFEERYGLGGGINEQEVHDAEEL